VVRALGMGLDEKALEAVKKYKFKPAMKEGRTPVPVMITVEVNFRLY
jgi:TonB family protein